MPTIDILANTRQAQSQIKDLSKGLDDVADSLDDVARDSKDSANKVEASFREMQRASSKVEDSTKDAARTIRREYKDAYRDAERAADDNLGKIKEGANELQSEIGANLGEVASSIRGDFSDLGQIGQDTLGGLSATLAGTGPAGLVGAAVLAAGAIGLGAVTAELEKQEEQAQRLKERMTDVYTAAAQAGRDYIDVASIIADAQDVINNPERADEYQRLLDTQKETGLSMSTILQANAGDMTALKVVTGQVRDEFKQWYAQQEDTPFWDPAPIEEVNTYWKQTEDAATTASEKMKASLDATNQILLDQINIAGDVGMEVDELGNKLIHLPDGDVMIHADTGKATNDVSKFRGDTDGVVDHLNGREVVLKARVDDSDVRNWRAPMLAPLPLKIKPYLEQGFLP